MGKAASLAGLYKAAVKEYTRTPEEWKGLLSCAARFYKRSFDNAVLIYAQRPNATQLGTFDEWHDRRVGRSINRGAKSIAVIDMANPGASIKYLFDFMDTNGSAQSYRNLQKLLWELEGQYRPGIMARFHEKYGTPLSSVESCLYHLVSRQVGERLPAYLDNFKVTDEASPLYGMPEEAVKAEFMGLVEESAAYTVFSKCGLSVETFGNGSFGSISNYGSLQLFMALGNCTVSIARPILNEIYREIQEIKTERSKAYEDRTVDGFYIQDERRRNALSGDPGVGKPAGGPVAGGAVREPVERIYDGETPAPAVGTGGTGADQRNYPSGGQGGGAEERSADPGTADGPPYAGYGRYDRESGLYEHDNERSGRDSDRRSGTESKVTQALPHPAQGEQLPADGLKPSVGGFFVVPPKEQETVEIPQDEKAEISEQKQGKTVLQAPGIDPAQGTAETAQPEQVSAQRREEKLQPVNETDQKQDTDGGISRIMDALLCAKDLFPDAEVWHPEIREFFQRRSDPKKKASALKTIYGELDEDYTIQGNHKVHIQAQGEGLMLQAYGSSYFYPYPELVKRIEALILSGEYPSALTEKKPGVSTGHDEKEGLGKQAVIDHFLAGGNLLGYNGKLKVYQAMVSGLSVKERIVAIKKEYGISGQSANLENGGHYSISADSKGFKVEYSHDGVEIKELLSWGKVEGRIMGLVRQDAYLGEDEKAGLGEFGSLHNAAAEAVETGETPGGQLSLFDLGMEAGYEDNAEPGQDAMLDAGETFIGAAALPPTMDYRYSVAHHLYDGGPKTKFQNNVAAIRLLKELENQGRRATPEEQAALAKFVGWGGLANALTPGKSGWEAQYEEIRSLLTEEEFQAARESTLTAYYTEQGIIRHIYSALERFGFHGGNILDPAMATGNFFSVLPEGMAGSRLYGVEIEPISGNIAKHLYPSAEIQVTGFEHTSYPDQFFDVVIGNIPFNSIKVDDPKYNRYNFRIHDYFLAKSLDKVRPGGIVAVITSKYTMDKANPANRRYLAQRAELLGAIRLPNTAFKQVAGTKATTDILFLKKREREIVPDEKNSPWLAVEKDGNGIPMNAWFISHPEMVLGKMVFDESVYGNEKSTACHPIPGESLDERLGQAVRCLEGKYGEPGQEGDAKGKEGKAKGKEGRAMQGVIPADPSVRNYAYAVVDGKLYYREHSLMYGQDITGKKAERIRGLVGVTQAVRRLIDFQNQEAGQMPAAAFEDALKGHIGNLNKVYDSFVKEYGYINAVANVSAFSRDANAPLLRSIEKEKKDEKGVYEKTAIFYKATIRPKAIPSVAESAGEALKISLNVKGRVDLDYMAGLYRKPDNSRATKDEVIAELGEQIYQDPVLYRGDPYAGWQTAGEYLSGYVKDKLAEAVIKAEEEPERFSRNVEALRAVQPVPLTPQEISFSLGTPWIPLEVYQEFMYGLFKTQKGNRHGRHATELEFSRYSGAYFISNKGNEAESVTANRIYGTERMSAYEILEASLNLRFVEVKDRVEYADPDTGENKVKYVLNKKETILAREKQAQVKAEFEKWLFTDPDRGVRLTKLYNDRFNNIRPRTYDGSGLVLPDLSGDIKLRPHQLDAVAHGLYGDGNLLMAHEVGAGKTYAAIVLVHELKRLGKASKPLITVPNHLVGQWSDAYMELYPNADILVAEKKDFQKQNRRRFVSRIATGEYDCIIMAHSSFELIGMSRERQLSAMGAELDAVAQAIEEEKYRGGKDWSLKQMQIFRKNLQFKYDQLFNAEKKDDVVNFEELGVDALVVDEAHAYKNNFSYTKMRNVAGISGQSSQRAMDMYQKCQYINEISGGRGVIYLTGTPVSNSMSELYVMQKTLQPRELERRGLLMFDAWAGTFGKVVSSLEIRPEGSGYQMNNRFAQFHNLPELMGMFSMVADIRTADMLDLPTPELKTGRPQVIKSACTPEQKQIVMELGQRAEAIRNGEVDSSQDNFLKLTHEARLLSTDPRAIDPGIPDDPGTKLNLCAENVAKIYHETKGKRLVQIIFCDQGTPKYDGSLNFYEATKAALLERGVELGEVSFIHDAKTDVQREQLFEKVRKGEVRILMGSTEKMGTGMNVQEKLIALHHLDVPWRPADLTQRNGRILRQGNENREVSIFNYITENTFDSYLWQILEQKQRYISQVMTGRSALRTCEDLDETVLQYAEFKAMATSDPRVREKMETDNEIGRLAVLRSSWQAQQAQLQEKVSRTYPLRIARKEKEVAEQEEDIRTYEASKPEVFRMEVDGCACEERTKAAERLKACGNRAWNAGGSLEAGNYAGFTIRLVRADWGGMSIRLCGKRSYGTEYGDSGLGNISRIEHLAERILTDVEHDRRELGNLKQQLAEAKEACGKPFPDEERLQALQKKKVQLDLALEFKEDGDGVVATDGGGDSVQAGGETCLALGQRLYQKLYVFAASLLDGEAYYMKLQSEGYEDLVLEDTGGGEYSIAHYYEKNGDSMRDPEVTFRIDREMQSLHPTSYLQDDAGIYYETEGLPPAKLEDLEEFMLQWFTNIINQGFKLVKAGEYAQEEENGTVR